MRSFLNVGFSGVESEAEYAVVEYKAHFIEKNWRQSSTPIVARRGV